MFPKYLWTVPARPNNYPSMKNLFLTVTMFLVLGAYSPAHATRQSEDYALFVTIKIKPGNVPAYEALLRPYLKKVRAEKGIWAYKIHRSAEDPAVFEIYAHFASAGAHQNHLNQLHTKHYLANATALFEAGYPVRRKAFEVRF